MEKQINISNYEAYYLDYLEGNLDEQSKQLLLAFLDSHPELQVDGSDFLALSVEKNESPIKSFLIQKDENLLEINAANLERLIIAKNEGLLDAQKEKALSEMIATNESFSALSRQYQYTKLQSPTFVYPHKKQLKKRPVYLLWAYAASVAAMFILLFSMYQLNQNFVPKKTKQLISQREDKTNKSTLKTEVVESQIAKSSTIKFEKNSNQKKEIFVNETPMNNQNIATHLIKKDSVYLRKNDPLENNYAFVKDEVLPHHVVLEAKQEKNNSDLTYLDMKNPIAPITKLISEKTKTEVDFKTAKKTENKAGGFYLKIGKLEISHRKH